MIFVDSNVLLDLVAPAGPWRKWSEAILSSVDAPLVTSRIVLAEIARQFISLEAERNFLSALAIELLDFPEEAAFRAGKAHAAYRTSGGTREAILADFLIGGHAASLRATLLTRDRARFASYFPELSLITPETEYD